MAAITKHHRLGGLINNRNLFPHGSGGEEFKIKVKAGLASEDHSPGFIDGHLPLGSSDDSLSMGICVRITSSYKNTSHWLIIHS